MKRIWIASFAILALCGAAFAREDQVDKASNVMQEIMNTPDKGIPNDLLGRAMCVGIVPSELKAAFVIGATYGRGVLVCRQRGNGPWGPPSEFTLGAGSFGFQIGGSSTDVVFLVMNESGARKLMQDHVRLGADASVAAGPVGRSAAAETDAELHAEILSYSRSRGLFAGVSLAGAVFKTDRDGNMRLYGHPYTAREILFHHVVTHEPPECIALDRALDRYSPRGGRAMAGL